MATQRGEEPQHISSADQAQQIFQRYDTAGTGLVDAWDIRAALKEMGKEMTDPMIFDMLRVNDTEVASVSLEKFLDMCDADVSDDGPVVRSAFRNQVEFQKAWEAVGGRKDLSGEVDGRKIKALLDAFELRTEVDALLADKDRQGAVDFAAFCTLLEPREPHASRRSMSEADMRRPFSSRGHAAPERNGIAEALRSQRSQREARTAGPGSLRTLSMQVQHGVGLARINSKRAQGSPADARARAAPPQRRATMDRAQAAAAAAR